MTGAPDILLRPADACMEAFITGLARAAGMAILAVPLPTGGGTTIFRCQGAV